MVFVCSCLEFDLFYETEGGVEIDVLHRSGKGYFLVVLCTKRQEGQLLWLLLHSCYLPGCIYAYFNANCF